MSEMVDRITAKIERYFDPYWDDIDRVREIVRVALEAMREPTKKMLKAGNRVTTDGRGAEESWPAMIDEAMK